MFKIEPHWPTTGGWFILALGAVCIVMLIKFWDDEGDDL